MKVMEKTTIYRKRCVDTVLNERTLLSELMHPFVGNLKYAFQDESNVYLVTEFITGGDLGYYIYVKKVKFKEHQA